MDCWVNCDDDGEVDEMSERAMVECEHCHAGVRRWREDYMESKNHAIAAWNRRAEK